ncbi:hypothetical protein [Taibaiella soli]|uniref:Uncharacterized protein n=1 Tax=Taibaiella soli TaxID=1649169 RepID=A0A2W2BUX0_9BACT|nr:hypothetical protein [Taibaiella soli]PZF71613.1 hypothetical protein DN068_16190 [Taibaiella soli]
MLNTYLFLNVRNSDLNNEWNKKLELELKTLPGIDDLMIIEHNENSDAQINMTFDAQIVSLDNLELLLAKNGTTITAINIHFPSAISGVSDAYSAAAINIPTEDKLDDIPGVLGVGVSTSGVIKVELDASLKNKNDTVQKIIQSILNRSRRN